MFVNILCLDETAINRLLLLTSRSVTIASRHPYPQLLEADEQMNGQTEGHRHHITPALWRGLNNQPVKATLMHPVRSAA